MTDLEKQKELLKYLRIRKILKARDSFWEFQKVINPLSFREEYTYLIVLALCLQSFYTDEPVEHFSPININHHRELDLDDGNIPLEMTEEEGGTRFKVDISHSDILVIECPPRHKKSYSLINFEDWIFGKNPDQIIITCAHNVKIANRMSQFVRNGIDGTRLKPIQIIYNDIFPNTVLKYGQKAKEEWAIEGQHISYVAGGILSGVTSMGGNLIIFDDLIKGALEAFNVNHLEKVWDSYTGSWVSRLEKPRKQILVMTPWMVGDPGDLIQKGADESGEIVKVLNLKAYSEKQGMLCDDILDRRSFNILESRIDPMILSANYLSKRPELKGKLYKSLIEYEKLPTIKEYGFRCDTADMGDDFLCMIIYAISMLDEPYILDVLYTDDGQEITEPLTAKFLVENKLKYGFLSGKIEHNAGGGAFARAIDKIIKTETHKSDGDHPFGEGIPLTEIKTVVTNKIDIGTFTQTQNKVARIITASNFVQKHIFFPIGWKKRWPIFAKHIDNYMKDGKNQKDDGPDTLTMIAEAVEDRFPTYEEMIESVTATRSKHINKPHFG